MLYTNNNRLTQILATRKGAGMGIAGATILMIVMMLVLAILPAYRSITDQLKNNDAKKVYLQELTLKQQTMDALSEEYNANEDIIKRYDTYINTVTNSEVLLANLDQIAVKHNSILISLSFADTELVDDVNLTEFSGLLSTPVDIHFLGDLADLPLVLEDIEKYPVPINIDKVSYKHYVPEDDQGELQERLISLDPRFDMIINASYYIWAQEQ